MNEFNRPRKRKAEFIKAPKTLKAKVGSGGLSEKILDRAQALIENSSVDFIPLAEMYLEALDKGIDLAHKAGEDTDKEYVINTLIYPTMQLKSNGGMFKYPLISAISAKLIHFLEVIDEADSEVIEICAAFHTTIRAIIGGRVEGDGGEHGRELLAALDEACQRYFTKYPDNRDPRV